MSRISNLAEHYDLSQFVDEQTGKTLPTYQWHEAEHERLCAEYIEAYFLASLDNLTYQMYGYRKKVLALFYQDLDLYDKDAALVVAAWVKQRTDHISHLFHCKPEQNPHADWMKNIINVPAPLVRWDKVGDVYEYLSDTWALVEGKEHLVRRNWHYQPLQTYSPVIPLHALRIRHFLTNEGYTPNAWWVAVQEEHVIRQSHRGYLPRFLPEPLLVCNFNAWFVSVADWK